MLILFPSLSTILVDIYELDNLLTFLISIDPFLSLLITLLDTSLMSFGSNVASLLSIFMNSRMSGVNASFSNLSMLLCSYIFLLITCKVSFNLKSLHHAYDSFALVRGKKRSLLYSQDHVSD